MGRATPEEESALVFALLAAAPDGMPTLALVERLAGDGVPPSDALELIWRLRDDGELAMRSGQVVRAR